MAEIVVWLLFQTLRQRVDGKRRAVEEMAVLVDEQRQRAWFAVAGIDGQRCLRQVPACQLDAGLCTGLAAQGEDAGHEGEFTHRDAIDKIFAAAVDGIPDFEQVFTILGNLAGDDRVGMETEVVIVGQFIASGIADGHGGLKPAGDGVGKIGNQGTGAHGDDNLLALPGLEAILILVGGENLAVDGGGEGDGHLRRGWCGPGCRFFLGLPADSSWRLLASFLLNSAY